MKKITDTYTDRYGQMWGMCEGRKVKFTWVFGGSWYFYDTGDYINNAITA